jgi:cob(I)alamin adenosyltransferase
MFRSPLFAYRVSAGTSSYPTQVPRDPNEPVRLTRIYTRGGDKGETSLGDGSRVSKLDPRVAAIGDVDELNSLVGWAGDLERVQNELFDLGADLSVPYAGNEDRLRVADDAIGRLEHDIEEANAALPELKSFVLPGGSERAARLFLARAVCRRAERTVLAVPDTNPLAAVYLNRLSDLLFVLGRAANAEAGVPCPLWRPGSAP